jgi:hypothetical protein
LLSQWLVDDEKNMSGITGITVWLTAKTDLTDKGNDMSKPFHLVQQIKIGQNGFAVAVVRIFKLI